ncbi:hypothetical protein JTM00_30055 [Pseudomonas aeruginosa]|nr:hypothetical protein [Pseudomonas aeruginosa]
MNLAVALLMPLFLIASLIFVNGAGYWTFGIVVLFVIALAFDFSNVVTPIIVGGWIIANIFCLLGALFVYTEPAIGEI